MAQALGNSVHWDVVHSNGYSMASGNQYAVINYTTSQTNTEYIVTISSIQIVVPWASPAATPVGGPEPSTYAYTVYGTLYSTDYSAASYSGTRYTTNYTHTFATNITRKWSRTTSNQNKTITLQTQIPCPYYQNYFPTQTSTATFTITVPALQTYTVSYNANGGTGAPGNTTKYYGIDVKLSSTKPTRAGYKFMRWNTSQNGSGTNYNPGDTYKNNAGLTLYAIWHQYPSCTTNTTSTPPYYTNKIQYTAEISNIKLYDNVSLSSIKATLGSQVKTRSSAGSFVFDLPSTGTFSLIVDITDSESCTTTYVVDPFTVDPYVPPGIAFYVYRAKNVTEGGIIKYGIKDENSTTHVLIEANITYLNDIADLLEPIATIDRITTNNITWYQSYSELNGLSNEIDWIEYNPDSPASIYGLISGSFPILNSYLIGVIAKDSENGNSVEILRTVPPAFYTIDFLTGGHGMALGSPANYEGFYIGMEPYLVLDTNEPLDDKLYLFAQQFDDATDPDKPDNVVRLKSLLYHALAQDY